MNILESVEVSRHYPPPRGLLRGPAGGVAAVDGVTIALREGETLGLVGESGSGKSTLARLLAGLERPTSGDVLYRGEPADWREAEVRRGVQLLFQDPWVSLDPYMRVGDIVAEGLEIGGMAEQERGSRVEEVLRRVGLSPGDATRRPRDFSGGQKQRIALARALAVEPRVLLLDEPVAQLDPSVAAGILSLIARIQREQGLAVLLIAHDLVTVSRVAHRVAVMHRGRIVEEGTPEGVMGSPRDSQTRRLVDAIAGW